MQYVEILLILGLIVWQLLIFLHNRRLIQRVSALYPAPEQLLIEQNFVQGGTVVADLVGVNGNPSPEFATIVSATNEYLSNNSGAAADFTLIKDISERNAEALDDEIQAQIATPLYLGLLGTFLGAMFGLGSLLLSAGTARATSGSTASFLGDEQILSFLGGVAIAMVGSFVGLPAPTATSARTPTTRSCKSSCCRSSIRICSAVWAI